MILPSWTVKFAAAAVIPVAIGMGAAISAPSFIVSDEGAVVDHDYRPGEMGVDYAAVTGPQGPSQTGLAEVGALEEPAGPDCEAAVWPYIPAACLGEEVDKPDRRIIWRN
jgi:hypothetical protein